MFGSTLLLFGFDLELFQGLVAFLYDAVPAFRVIEDPNGAFRLELDLPRIETRADASFRMGVHLTGRLFLTGNPDALVFDAWVRLRPEVGDDAGTPVGVLRFDAVEQVTPQLAEQPIIDAFGPDGAIGSVLAMFTIPAFEELLRTASEQLFPGAELDLAAFSTSFYLGRPAALRRPVWDVARSGDHWEPALQFDVSHATVPALVASVALAGDDPLPPDAPSIVRPGTGLGLITTGRLFDGRFAIESAAAKGKEMSGLTIDELHVVSTDYGFDIDGKGHKTGADVSFAGSLIGIYRGGTGGQLTMRSTVETDVDTAWWVDVLSVAAALIPGLGWILGDIFIWGPTAEAPGKVEDALLEKFSAPLASAAQQLADGFKLGIIPTQAMLADVWFFEGNMGVAAVAFAGRNRAEVVGVEHDIAHVAKDPAGEGRHSNRRRPVTSVAEIRLSSGHALKPWQAGQLVSARVLDIPGHHAVKNPLAHGGVYLRSNPDDTSSNNLLS
ncbi:MAG TPA: hypothetical protein VFT22_16840 [Kofleriaceae bacterium]|nr:hypothetical protein [Kofleriaceae bacterium]